MVVHSCDPSYSEGGDQEDQLEASSGNRGRDHNLTNKPGMYGSMYFQLFRGIGRKMEALGKNVNSYPKNN
jgi:hypothetical protein